MPIHPPPQPRQGRIEAVVGGMFGGKTEEAIRRARREKYAGKNVIVFKHTLDIRYAIDALASHCGGRIDCIAVESVEDMELHITDETHVIVIDEAQFYGEALVRFVLTHRLQGRLVIVAGLNMDYKGVPFGVMPTIMAIANQVDVLTAVCTTCGKEAGFSQRLVPSRDVVDVGEGDKYAARCLLHWDPEGTE